MNEPIMAARTAIQTARAGAVGIGGYVLGCGDAKREAPDVEAAMCWIGHDTILRKPLVDARDAAAAWRMRRLRLGLDGRNHRHARPQFDARSRSSGSSAIFTGMRCTTLVKLPVALSGGSSANSWPLAGAMLSTWPCTIWPGNMSTAISTALALADVGQLGLLEVGHHIGAGDRHHRHQLRAGLHELADAQRAVADDAVDRRDDRGVVEIELGLALQRLGARQRRIGLNDLGLEQIDLLHGGGEIGGVARDRGLRAGVARLRLLRVLHAAEAGRREVGVALVLLRGEGDASPCRRRRSPWRRRSPPAGRRAAPACWRSPPAPRRHRPWPGRARR